MAFAQGDLITANALNTVNSGISKSWSWGHAGWSWRTADVYFYCTRTSGNTLLTQSNSTSTGNQKKLTLWRYEDGAWVQKNYSDTASGTKTITWNSYGIGAYHFRVNDHNNTPSLVVYPSKVDCTKGNFLAMLSSDPREQDSSTVLAVNNRNHGVLTVGALNAGRVYTL
jgi:hypothetical protein